MKLIALLLVIFSGITPIFAQPAGDQLLSPPANDNFASPRVLTGLSAISTLISNAEATGEIGEPNHGGVAGPLNSIWYAWTAPATVSITMQADAGSGFDPVMAVYTGTAVNALTLVASNDNAGNLFFYSRVTFLATAGTTYHIAVDGVGSATGLSGLSLFINRAENGQQFDFDGDAKSDFAVFRPGTNTWYIRRSSDGSLLAQAWGASGDLLSPGDYDGDLKTDICVFRPSNGTFYALKSSNGELLALRWGQSGDVPVQGDFDGDDQADFAVYRPSTDTFYVHKSTDGGLLAQQWGEGGTDVVAPGDYDGDGKTDFAVYRYQGPEAGHFYVLRSSDGAFVAQLWGLGPDLVVPGDYDNDGRTDFIVHRSSDNTFYGLSSAYSSTSTVMWGTSGDRLTPGDYDGDGRSDAAVWRPSGGVFYVRSSLGPPITQPWGASGDTPVALSNVH